MKKSHIFSLKIILSVCLSTQMLFAQEKRSQASFKDSGTCGLQCRIKRSFLDRELKNECGYSIFYTKFTVSAEGKIKDINFSNGTKPFMRELMTDALQATNGLWAPETVNDKAVDSKPFLIPIAYSFSKKCMENLDTMILLKGEFYIAHPSAEAPEYRTDPLYSVLHMLDFSKEEDTTIRFFGSQVFPQFEGYVLSAIYLNREVLKPHYD